MHHLSILPPWHSYMIEEGVCYLCLCEPSYPTTLAFEYLKAVSEEFSKQCGRKIYEAHRPYHFIEFGKCIHRQTGQEPLQVCAIDC